jgi:hypothetical protein
MWVCFDKILSRCSTPKPKDESKGKARFYCPKCSAEVNCENGIALSTFSTTPKVDEGAPDKVCTWAGSWEEKPMDIDELKEFLSRRSVGVEPLAVLADRKGWYIGGSFINRQSRWQIDVCKGYEVDGSCDEYEVFTHRDYAAAEALARVYLATLPDKSKGETK